MQWLDVVWQLTRQYPLAFEFSEQFLIEVQDQMMGGRFGTFLYNSAKERHEADVRNKTASLWTHTCAPANRARVRSFSSARARRSLLCTLTLVCARARTVHQPGVPTARPPVPIVQCKARGA